MTDVSQEFMAVSIARELPVTGRQLFAAVWNSSAGHVLIGAPTEEELRLQWLRITGKALADDAAQCLAVIKARVEDLEVSS